MLLISYFIVIEREMQYISSHKLNIDIGIFISVFFCLLMCLSPNCGL